MDIGQSRILRTGFRAAIILADVAIATVPIWAAAIDASRSAATAPSDQDLALRCAPIIIAKCAKGLEPVCVANQDNCCTKLACREKTRATG